MTLTDFLKDISFGYSIIVGITAFAYSDSLWKKNLFNKCFAAAILSGISGLVLEVTDVFHLGTGVTIIIMIAPLIYLAYFQLFRYYFIKWNGTEPYVTSSSSVIGATPLDMFSKASKDGKKRKYEKNRKIIGDDFTFSFFQALVPIFTILLLLLLVIKMNK
ncbi:MAG: hypothetical protein ACR2LT_04310 [Pyrinomonadaceae bacterium]